MNRIRVTLLSFSNTHIINNTSHCYTSCRFLDFITTQTSLSSLRDSTQEHRPSSSTVSVLNRSEQCHTSLNMNFTEWIRAVPELMTKVGQLLGEYTGAEQ